MGWVYEALGLYDDACREHEEAVRLDPTPSWRLANLARAAALAGKPIEARRRLDELLKRRGSSYVSAVSLAEVFAALEDLDQAFAWLAQGYAERDSQLVYLAVNRRVENLCADARFQELLERIGFPLQGENCLIRIKY